MKNCNFCGLPGNPDVKSGNHNHWEECAQALLRENKRLRQALEEIANTPDPQERLWNLTAIRIAREATLDQHMA